MFLHKDAEVVNKSKPWILTLIDVAVVDVVVTVAVVAVAIEFVLQRMYVTALKHTTITFKDKRSLFWYLIYGAYYRGGKTIQSCKIALFVCKKYTDLNSPPFVKVVLILVYDGYLKK